MPNVETAITGFDNFCKAGSKMLQTLNWNLPHTEGYSLPPARVIVVANDEPKTGKEKLNVAAASREAVASARVPDHYSGTSAEELIEWGAARRTQAERDLLGHLVGKPSRALGY